MEITLDNVFDAVFYTLLAFGTVMMVVDGTLAIELLQAVVVGYILSRGQS